MNEQDIAIRLTGVKKRYKLGQIGGGTLTADLQSWWARLRGKEDPNLPVNMDQRLVGKTFMALNGVDLTVHKGEALGIIGCNGAGKSTLLKLLCRVTAPTEGEIDIYGRIASMLEVGTGFNGEMTGRENIYMNGAILGMTKAEIDAKIEDIIEFSEVRDFIDTPVKRYSSGMFVKLAFSVAAHLDSEIMIMDEVLAVGDMAFQKKCLDKMRQAAKQEDRTVLYVSHNMNTIRRLCDRCVVLDKGKVIFDGDVEKAIELYLSNTRDDWDESRTEFDLTDCRGRSPYTAGLARIDAVKLLDKEAGDRSGKLYGLGHAVYTMSDPRAVLLKKYAQHMAEIKGYADEFALLQKVEELGIPLVQERRHSDTPMCANVDMYSGLVYTMLGIPEDVFTPLFASARIAGWCANRMEEVITCHRIMRPAYRAVTIKGHYVPIEERTAKLVSPEA